MSATKSATPNGPSVRREAGAPPFRETAHEETVDLLGIVRALRANLKAIVGVTTLALIGSIAFVTTTAPRYQGTTQILLESRESSFTRPVEAAGADQTQRVIDEQAVASQVQIVRSRDVAREAAQRLALVGNPEFDPQVRPMNPIARILGSMGLGGDEDAGTGRAPEDRVLSTYYDRLVVYPVGRSRVISVEFQARDPELAARGANTIADVYLEALEEAKVESARGASSWLSQNIDRLRERVREAEARVEEFRSGTGLLVGSNNSTLTTQQLGDLSAQLAGARAQQAESEARARLIRELIEAGRAFEIPDVANDGLIQNLIQDRIALRTQIANESRTLLPRHPRVMALEAQLVDLDGQIRGVAERTVRALENEARLAGTRVETLSAALDRQMQVASRANENEVQLRALDREATAEREQLEVFLARYRDAVARDSNEATLPDAIVVSRAAPPEEPIWPLKGPLVFLITVGALVLAVGTVVMKAIVFDIVRPTGPALAPQIADFEPAPRQDERPAAATAVQIGEAEPEPPLDPVPPGGGARRDRRPRATGATTRATGFDIPALAARLGRTPAENRGRRVLVCALDEPGLAGHVSSDLAEAWSATSPALLVDVDANADASTRPGFADLVAGAASFFEAIDRMPGGRPHRIPAGSPDIDALAEDLEDDLDIALSAFDQTYDWTLLVVSSPLREETLARLAMRVDAVVVAARTSVDDPALVGLYDRAKAAGAPDVVVAISAERLTDAA